MISTGKQSMHACGYCLPEYCLKFLLIFTGEPEPLSYMKWSREKLQKAVQLSKNDMALATIRDNGPHFIKPTHHYQ